MAWLRSLAPWMSNSQAQTFQGVANVAPAITALGSTQGTAFVLVAETNLVTSAAAATGVLLPSGNDLGDEVSVVNAQGTNALLVYPPTGATINGLAANAGYTLAVNKGAAFKRVTALAWTALGA